jgi:hypothetical protein
LLKRGEFFIGNEKPVVALEEVREDENLVTRGQEIARLEALESIDGDTSASDQFRRCQLSLVAVRPQLSRNSARSIGTA